MKDARRAQQAHVEVPSVGETVVTFVTVKARLTDRDLGVIGIIGVGELSGFA